MPGTPALKSSCYHQEQQDRANVLEKENKIKGSTSKTVGAWVILYLPHILLSAYLMVSSPLCGLVPR